MAVSSPSLSLSELMAGAFVVTDSFADDPDRVAFRTLIHIDGDLCLTIDPGVLALPDFGAQLDAHTTHVSETIAAHHRLARNRIQRLSDLLGSSGLVAYIVAHLWQDYDLSSLSSVVEQFVNDLVFELAGLALASAAGIAISTVARALIRQILRRGLGDIGKIGEARPPKP